MENESILARSRHLFCFAFGLDGCNVHWRLYCLVNFPAIYMIRRLPLKVLHLYVLLSLVVFLFVQSLKYFSGVRSNWIFHHLNDFLTIPLVATLCLHGAWLIKKDNTIRLNIFTILSLVALFSVAFEYYLPQQSHRYTGDIWDVVCYFLGGVVFYLLQKVEYNLLSSR